MTSFSRSFYQTPLARIHDEGFLKYCESAADICLESIASRGIQGGTVIDLGCGSGRLVELVGRGGHQVTGVDISQGMLQIARQRCPSASWVLESVWDYHPTDCDYLTAVGEVLNYRQSDADFGKDCDSLFNRIHAALRPGGEFLFDMATAGRLGGATERLQFFETDDWSIVVESTEWELKLTRRCIVFSREEREWTRHEETHLLELMEPEVITSQLVDAGFQVECDAGYGETALPHGMCRFRATKP